MMKNFKRYILALAAVAIIGVAASAQESSRSTLRRGSHRNAKEQTAGAQVTKRMENRMEQNLPGDADLAWMRVIYRELDLTKEANAPLYYPEEPTQGQESMFRLLMRLLAGNQLAVYEYLDGREVFTDQYRLKVKDMLDRFHIYYKEAKGSTEKAPKFEIHESDIPAQEVLSYYIIERYEFDRRTNKLRTVVEAICPVLHRSDEWGMEAVRYPMFWVKFSDLRPYLSSQNIFTSDSNNLATCTYDDFFQLGLYKGDIFKTRNLRNKSLAQLYPNADDRRHAQDSIQQSIERFGKDLWVPSLEELQAAREKREEMAAKAAGEKPDSETSVEADGDKPAVAGERRISSRRGQKASKPKQAKAKVKKPKQAKASSGAVRSVRNNRKR